jgi:prepilin-type N-terminal cleavage/methylation domain-containing protein
MSRPAAVLSGMPSRTASRRQRGFSLVEMLVTLIVIVLVTSWVTFSFNAGGPDVVLAGEVRNLAGVAAYALDEAQMTGVDYGLLLEEASQEGEVVYSYRWLERRPDGWEPPESGKDLFERRSFPPGVELELELEDAPLVELSLADDNSEIIRPQVVFYASGETTVGAINVRRRADGDLLWRIEWDLLGRFKLLQRGEEPVAEDA